MTRNGTVRKGKVRQGKSSFEDSLDKDHLREDHESKQGIVKRLAHSFSSYSFYRPLFWSSLSHRIATTSSADNDDDDDLFSLNYV
jgi:hypothetical protein